MTPQVSVVIPAHNASATISAQLKALAAQRTDLVFEVIVVDNRSTDDTAVISEGFRDRLPLLRVVSAKGGRGAAYARNSGVAQARADLLLFCDADDEVAPGWMGAMVQGLRDADLVGGAIEVARLNPARVQAGYPNLASDLQLGRHGLRFATGCSMGIHRAVFDQLGGFVSASSPAEDQELSVRAQLAGFRLGFVPGAVVHYRLRIGLRATARQYFHYGRSDTRLFRSLAQLGAPMTQRTQLRIVGHHLLRGPRAIVRGRQYHWVRQVSLHTGRLVGLFEQPVTTSDPTHPGPART